MGCLTDLCDNMEENGNAQDTAEWFWKVKVVGLRLECLKGESLRTALRRVIGRFARRAEAHGSFQYRLSWWVASCGVCNAVRAHI